MVVTTKNSTVYILVALLLCSLMVRLWLFAGFVLGDDTEYAGFAARLLQDSYPVVGTHNVFPYRPIVLYAIAFCLRLFGWFDWSFVLPVLCASLVNTAIVYFAAVKLGGIRAGVLAALAYIVFPLDAVHATTMSNDIMLSTFVWGGGLLLLLCKDSTNARAALVLAFISGLVVGASVGVKLNGVVAPVLFVGLGAVYALRSHRSGFYSVLALWFAGWLAANAALCLFFYTIGGDPLLHYHAEMRFNEVNNPSGFIFGKSDLLGFLLIYPRMIFALATEGPDDHTFLPYGYFFLTFMLCLPLCLLERFKALRMPALCALFFLMVMEFSPITFIPHYVPIHRLPRFLHIACLPAAVVLGLAFSCLMNFRFRAITMTAAAAFLFLLVTSGYWAWVKASYYRDCTLDQCWAWEAVQGMPAKEIITDLEMHNYFLFRSGYAPAWQIKNFDNIPAELPADALVVVGGSRRPESNWAYMQNWLRKKKYAAAHLIAEAPYDLQPWRPSKLAIYRIQ